MRDRTIHGILAFILALQPTVSLVAAHSAVDKQLESSIATTSCYHSSLNKLTCCRSLFSRLQSLETLKDLHAPIDRHSLTPKISGNPYAISQSVSM